ESIDALLQGGVELKRYNAKQYLFKEGDDADGLYLIRRGSVEVTRKAAGQDQALGYVAAGGYVGEMALIDDSKRSASVMATVLTEALVFEGARFKAEIERNPKLKETLQALILERTRANVTRADTSANSSYMAQFLVAQGVGDASNILVIDETKCVQCNNCETACAETHDGVSRLRRDVGPTLNHLHIPVACRHCENPHCMKDCPPDAISLSMVRRGVSISTQPSPARIVAVRRRPDSSPISPKKRPAGRLMYLAGLTSSGEICTSTEPSAIEKKVLV
ncbi:MAG: hypothetical protein EBV35_05400, partial [Betaproteobacteria bacterium]|nr:hypothetical protein [Betaproteobacteria bacterium]